jgi:hypothetical protein
LIDNLKLAGQREGNIIIDIKEVGSIRGIGLIVLRIGIIGAPL